MFEIGQEEEDEWMESLLKRITVNKKEMSQGLTEKKADISCLKYAMLTNM